MNTGRGAKLNHNFLLIAAAEDNHVRATWRERDNAARCNLQIFFIRYLLNWLKKIERTVLGDIGYRQGLRKELQCYPRGIKSL